MPRNRLSRQQAAAIPGNGRVDQRGGFESVIWARRGRLLWRCLTCRRAAVLRKRFSRQHNGRRRLVRVRRRARSRDLARRRLLFKFKGRNRFGRTGNAGLCLRGRFRRNALLSASAAAATPSAPAASASLLLILRCLLCCENTRRHRSSRLHRRFFRRAAVLTWLLLSLAGTRAAVFLTSTVTVDSLRSVLGHAMRMLYLARGLTGGRGLLQLVGFFLVFELDEVGDVEERIALQAQVDKCRLHAGENPRHASVVDGTREGVFVFAFVVDFRELIVF